MFAMNTTVEVSARLNANFTARYLGEHKGMPDVAVVEVLAPGNTQLRIGAYVWVGVDMVSASQALAA